MTLYIGVDFHPHQQTACWCDMETGEIKTRTLFHNTDEIKQFYQTMPPSTIGIEATSKATWFENLLFENQHKLLIGDPKLIRKRAASRHKSDNRDAANIFDLLIRTEFPTLWRRTPVSSARLELMRLRHNLVKQLTQTYNRLQALAHAAGLPKGKIRTYLFQARLQRIELSEAFNLQRQMLFEVVANLNQQISQLELWLQAQAAADAQVKLLLTQKGVGYLTALCLIDTIGDISRFTRPTKQVPAFVGLDPVEMSSGSKTKFGSISKAGSPLLRFLLGQATQSVSRYDQKLKAKYKQLSKKKHKAVAKTAIARKLLVKLTIMVRDKITADEFDLRGRTARNARKLKGLQ